MSDRELLRPGDHPEKEVRKALREICKRKRPSFHIEKGGHWGTLCCSNGCCRLSISGSPRNPQRHAQDLVREANKCPRKDGDVRMRRPRIGRR